MYIHKLKLSFSFGRPSYPKLFHHQPNNDVGRGGAGGGGDGSGPGIEHGIQTLGIPWAGKGGGGGAEVSPAREEMSCAAHLGVGGAE